MDRAGLSPRAPAGPFGRLAFGFLAVAAVSGFALAPFWSAARPLDAVERIEGAVPWGFFLRGLHAFSSWAFLVTAVWHGVEVLFKRTERQLGAGLWWLSVSLAPLSLLALLSGFVLRGDAEAEAALAVWRRIAEGVPLLGSRVATLLLGSAPRDLSAVALQHAGALTLLLLLFTAAHAGTLAPDSRSVTLAGLLAAAFAGAFPVGLGRAPGAEAHGLLLGPWYLLGLQGALVDLPVACGWLLPLFFLLVLGLVRHAEGRKRVALVGLLLVFLAADLAFTVRLFFPSSGAR